MDQYFSFLYHNHLKDISELCLRRFYEGNHFISFYIFPDKTESKELLEKEVEQFLKVLIQNRVMDEIGNWCSDLKSGKLLYEPSLAEILPIFYNRKFILLEFLHYYSKDAKEVKSIAQDIEKFFHAQEIYAIANMEAAHKNQLKELKKLLEESESLGHIAHCDFDYTNGTIKCSKEFYEIFGIELQTDLSFNLLKSKTIYENGFDPFSDKPSQNFKEGKPNFHEFKIKRNNDDVRTIYSEDFPLADKEGKVIGLRRFTKDITQLREVEGKVNKEEKLLKRIFESLPIYIGIYSIEEGKVIYANQSAIKLFQLASEDIYESKFTTVIDNIVVPEDKEKLYNRLLEYPYSTEDDYPQMEYKVVLPNKKNIWFYTKSIVFKSEDNRVKEVLISAIDITALKETEEKLKLNEEKLILAQKIAKVGNFDMDLDKGTSIISADLVEIYNLNTNTKTFSYPEFRKIVRSDFISKMDENMNDIMYGSIDNLEDEIVIVMPDNSEKDVLIRSRIYRNNSGKAYRVIGTVLDITSIKENERKIHEKNIELQLAYKNLEMARKNLEDYNIKLEHRVNIRTQELKKSKEQYELFVKQSSIGLCRLEFKDIVTIDTSLSIDDQVELIISHIYIAEINDCLVHMLGFKKQEELIGYPLREFIEISDMDLKMLITKAIRSDYKIQEIELLGKRQKDKPKYLHIKMEGVIEDGKLTRVWGIISDISSRKYSEIKLKESERKYKTLSEAIPGFTWTANSDGNNDYINQRWFEFTGATFEQSQNWNWLMYIHPDEVEGTKIKWKNCLNSGCIYENEYRIRRFDGVYKWYQVRAIPIKNNEGEIIKWIGIQTDIDDKKNSEENLIQKNEDLDNFIYMVSHDLKAPVSNIEGLVSVLNGLNEEENKIKKSANEALEMIETSIAKFKNNLLELIEIAKSQQASIGNKEDICLPDLLNEVKSLLEQSIKNTNAIIQENFSECSTIRFVKKNLQSIVHNLLSNALKFHSPDRIPEILISTKLEENYVVLSVKDNGLGIDTEQAGKIFSEFKRLHKEVEGSGVGLYLVKRIITDAGGKIEVEGEKGKGSIFKVYFKL